MRRITCKTPSPASPLSVVYNTMPAAWVTLAEAPDFSVPDAAGKFPERDPLDSARAIRPGEVFFTAPLMVRNPRVAAITVTLRVVKESDEIAAAPDPAFIATIMGPITVPPGETVQLPIQGRSLLRRDPSKDNGDILQVYLSAGGDIGMWLTAQERLAADHIGIEA